MTNFHHMTDPEIDAAYDNRAHAGDWRAILRRWSEASARLYDTRPVCRDLRYGPHARHRLDLFPASSSHRPTIFYIHGGYWQWVDKHEEAFVAEGPLSHELNVVLCEYRLCPDATFDDVVQDVSNALDWLATRLSTFGADPARLVVAGSSAGAHLAATLLARPIVKGALLISGIYDIEPIARTRLNETLKLDEDMVRRHSPIRHIPQKAEPVCFAIGSNELPEMIRQTQAYSKAWIARGLLCSNMILTDSDHFTVLDHLASPHGDLTVALLHLCETKMSV